MREQHATPTPQPLAARKRFQESCAKFRAVGSTIQKHSRAVGGMHLGDDGTRMFFLEDLRFVAASRANGKEVGFGVSAGVLDANQQDDMLFLEDGNHFGNFSGPDTAVFSSEPTSRKEKFRQNSGNVPSGIGLPQPLERGGGDYGDLQLA